MKKVLIIQTAFIGDVILATPIIETIHLNFPDCILDFMVKKGNEILLADHPTIRKVYLLDKQKKLRSMFQNIKSIRKEDYDFVINLQRFASSGLISGFSKAKKIIGFKNNPFSWMYHQRSNHSLGKGEHEVDRNLALINQFCHFKQRKPRLYPSKIHFEKIKKYSLESYICIAPASVWKTKEVPHEKWLELIKLIDDRVQIYLVGAPSDFELCEKIINDSKDKKIRNLCGELSLMDTAALFKSAEHVYVNDSGPLHIASAMNTPVTAFFCSTIPDFGFGPLSDISSIIEVPNLSCRPCGIHGKKKCPEGHFNCGNKLNVNLK